MTRQYAAFISYRHLPLDIAVAEKIHKSIERFRIPRDLRKEEQEHPGSVFTNWEGQPFEGSLLVFRYREELPLSNDLTADIFDALDHTKCLIVVCTPDTPKSLWVRREISYFIEKHGRGRIVTVLAAGTPEESIPKEITTVYDEDGVTVLEEYEPLVAYLTADSRKKVLKNLDKELIRLCAAILGCPYDALRQRHKRRKMQQTIVAFAAAFLVSLSFIGMLVNRNLEIEAQKRSVQLRESELLAADAREALLTGDTLRAIESAVSALPKEGEEDRPYYAPAENVLIEAMDILGGTEAPVLLKELALEQMTPISHFCLSPDGILAVTLDDYGVLHCFDTESGEELWTDILSADTASGSRTFVMISEDNQYLFCSYYNLMECRNPATGQVIWSYPLEYFYNGCFLYDHSQNRMALLRYYFHAEQYAYRLELILLNGETGETISRMVLEQPDSDIAYSLTNIASTRLPQNGAFSEDGRYLACAFPLEEKDRDVSGISCFVIDLEEMCVVLDYRQDLADHETYYVTGLELREDHLFLSLESDDDSIAAIVMKLNRSTGELLWSTATPSELENSTYSLDQTSSVLFWDSIAIVGRYEKLYSIDLDTGEVLDSVSLPSTLNYLYTVSSRYFAFSLADGTYAIGWYNPNYGFTLSNDHFYQVFAQVGAHTLLNPYQGGIVQMYTDGNYLELSVSNIEREGYLALVPSQKKNQLILKRPISVEKPVEQTIITLPVEQQEIYCSDVEPTFCSNNTLILGPFSIYGADNSSQYFYASIDRNTHQVTRLFDIEDTYNQQFHFLPDGSGYLRYTDGTTWLCKDGNPLLIAQRKDPEFPEDSYSNNMLIATDTVRLTDSNLLTAHCDSDSITLFVNGKETGVLSLPESHCYHADPTEPLTRRIFAGQNGGILTCCYAYGKDIPSDAFALYNAETGWVGFSEAFYLTNTNSLAFACQKKQIALADEQNQVRLFQLETGSQVGAFPLQLPSGSILSMDFILEDSCLLVKTQDAQILIYDLSTGQICFHDKLASTYTGVLHTYVDTENQRLYIIDSSYSSSPNCLCVDLRNWITLGSGSKVLCYDERTGELIHFDRHSDRQDSLSCIRVPGTDELVRLGQKLLAAR